MPGVPDPEYVLARRVLLDALQALGEQRSAVLLVGAQAIYLHTGDADLAVAPYTTDGDVAIDPSRLKDDPKLAEALGGAGFSAYTGQVGTWIMSRPPAGPLWQDNDLVFPTLTGTTKSGTNLLGRHFKPLLKTAELPPIRVHDLRHTCATILLMADKHPKYVQELLGHASIKITLDTYSHVIEGMDGGLADAMDDAL